MDTLQYVKQDSQMCPRKATAAQTHQGTSSEVPALLAVSLHACQPVSLLPDVVTLVLSTCTGMNNNVTIQKNLNNRCNSWGINLFCFLFDAVWADGSLGNGADRGTEVRQLQDEAWGQGCQSASWVTWLGRAVAENSPARASWGWDGQLWDGWNGVAQRLWMYTFI